jgi:hypothetical protein
MNQVVGMSSKIFTCGERSYPDRSAKISFGSGFFGGGLPADPIYYEDKQLGLGKRFRSATAEVCSTILEQPLLWCERNGGFRCERVLGNRGDR